MTTAFGPQGPNYTITRPPADPQASAGTDTWFKNCSAAGAKDGTFATAAFFNVTIGNLRYLVREAEIGLSDADDSMVYQAVRKIALDVFNENFELNLNADQGIKIDSETRYIQSTLGDGSRPTLTASSAHPAQNRVDVFDPLDGAHKEITPYELVKSVLANGTGISFTYDAVDGHITVVNTLPETGGGGGSPTTVYAKVPYAVVGGTASALTADFTPDIAALGAGDLLAIKLIANITGATTLTSDGGAAVDVVDSANGALVNNFASTGEVLLLMYDGAKLRVMNKQAPSTQLGLYALWPGVGSYHIQWDSAPLNSTVSGAALGGLPGTWKMISYWIDAQRKIFQYGGAENAIQYEAGSSAFYQRIA